jgi:hypothetical protein
MIDQTQLQCRNKSFFLALSARQMFLGTRAFRDGEGEGLIDRRGFVGHRVIGFIAQ